MNRDQNHLGSRGNKKNTSRGGVEQQRKAGTRSKEKGKFRATMSSLVLLGFPPQVSTHSLAHVQGNQTTPAHPRQAKGRETSCLLYSRNESLATPPATAPSMNSWQGAGWMKSLGSVGFFIWMLWDMSKSYPRCLSCYFPIACSF